MKRVANKYRKSACAVAYSTLRRRLSLTATPFRVRIPTFALKIKRTPKGDSPMGSPASVSFWGKEAARSHMNRRRDFAALLRRSATLRLPFRSACAVAYSTLRRRLSLTATPFRVRIPTFALKIKRTPKGDSPMGSPASVSFWGKEAARSHMNRRRDFAALLRRSATLRLPFRSACAVAYSTLRRRLSLTATPFRVRIPTVFV